MDKPTTRDRWAARLATARPQAPSPVPSSHAITENTNGTTATCAGQVEAENAQRAAERTRRPGRPAKRQRPLTDAERQAESRRRRRREAAVSVTDDLHAADDAVLQAGLALRLKDTRANGDLGDTARWLAGRIVGELCRRHGIMPG